MSVATLPESGAAVTVSGTIERVLGHTISGELQLLFSDNSGTIILQGWEGLHAMPSGIRKLRVRVTGVVERNWFGFGKKYIETSSIQLME